MQPRRGDSNLAQGGSPGTYVGILFVEPPRGRLNRPPLQGSVPLVATTPGLPPWASLESPLRGYRRRHLALPLRLLLLQPAHMCQPQRQNMFARTFGQLVVAVERARAFRSENPPLMIDA